MYQVIKEEKKTFLAATSSSRSDGVTKCVRPTVRSFVRPLFFSLVSLKSVAHLECYKASKSVKGIHCEPMCVSSVQVFKGCFNGVLRVFQGSFQGVSRKFQGCFKKF